MTSPFILINFFDFFQFQDRDDLHTLHLYFLSLYLYQDIRLTCICLCLYRRISWFVTIALQNSNNVRHGINFLWNFSWLTKITLVFLNFKPVNLSFYSSNQKENFSVIGKLYKFYLCSLILKNIIRHNQLSEHV